MAENNKLKHELADQLFDIKEKLTDAEYKTLLETVTKIKENIVVPPTPPIMHPVLPPVVGPPRPVTSTSINTQREINAQHEINAQLGKILESTFYKTCEYPNCNKKSIMLNKYCDIHLSSKFKKTDDTICSYKNLAGGQCTHKCQIGKQYCVYHIKDNKPKPPKPAPSTSVFKCQHIIMPTTKYNADEGKQCKKYALINSNFCKLHVDKHIVSKNVPKIINVEMPKTADSGKIIISDILKSENVENNKQNDNIIDEDMVDDIVTENDEDIEDINFE